MARFARIEVRLPAGPAAERLVAEAYAAGAVGLEEREDGGMLQLLLYAPAPAADAVGRAARALAGPAAQVGAVEPVPDVDWSERWKAGLQPIAVSPRLLIRPSFVPAPPAAGRVEILIDPGQAFGTGGHASTRLALEWIDQLAPGLQPGARVLDVGTGSGVLALAAARLAEVRVVALDLDPLAVRAARDNAVRNDAGGRVQLLLGPVAALGGPPFDLVMANLLRSELLPLAGELARATRPGGCAVLSGLLAEECDAVAGALASAGFCRRGVRRGAGSDGELWAALLMGR